MIHHNLLQTGGYIIRRAVFWIGSILEDSIPEIDCHTGAAYSKMGRIVAKYTFKMLHGSTFALFRRRNEYSL